MYIYSFVILVSSKQISVFTRSRIALVKLYYKNYFTLGCDYKYMKG